ncbi:MAG TPA: hypothetical protein VEW95_04910 [Candidatus Limnocylindrales bacterium]|nr:hypothetical protein [Candidatus Limnocylindrales bacterium]
MSRCHQADGVLERVFAGAPLTQDQAEHASACSECAHALSQAQRFDGELHRVGRALAPGGIPSADEFENTALAYAGRSGWLTRASRPIGIAAVTVMLVAVAAGASAGWIFDGPGSGADAIAPEALAPWLQQALSVAIEETAHGVRPDDWEPYQVEACGATAIVFYTEREVGGVRPMRWAVGEPGAATAVREVGIAASLADANVAAIRARLPICTVAVDPSLDEAAAREALGHAASSWGEGSVPFVDLREAIVLDVSASSRELFSVLLEDQQEGVVTRLDRVTVGLAEGGGYTLQHAAANIGVARNIAVYRDTSSAALATVFGLAKDAPVAAVDLIGSETRLRYPIRAPGFIIEAEVPDGGLRSFEIRDAAGNIIGSGRIEAWPHP